MTAIYKKSLALTLTNDEKLGALALSPDGSRFNVSLDDPITIPKNCVYCELYAQACTVWYVTPNISLNLKNNNFTFIYNNVTYTIIFQDGLYSLDQVNDYISKYLISFGFRSNLLVLQGDYSTQKCVITFNDTNLQIDFTTQNSIRTVLGFNAGVYPPVIQPTNYFVYGDNEAKFNAINSFYIRSTILGGGGIPTNNVNVSAIVKIPIPPNSVGRQITYEPVNPVTIDASTMIGKTISNFEVQLIDDNFIPCETLGEKYTITIQINYYMPL